MSKHTISGLNQNVEPSAALRIMILCMCCCFSVVIPVYYYKLCYQPKQERKLIKDKSKYHGVVTLEQQVCGDSKTGITILSYGRQANEL